MPALKPEFKKVSAEINGRKTYAIDYFKSDTDKQVFLGNPHLDNLASVVLALGAELWATKQRQIIAEKLAEQGIPATYQAIESYKPSKDEELQWEEERQQLAARVYGVLARETAATPVASK
jgi:hypothetical protein